MKEAKSKPRIEEEPAVIRDDTPPTVQTGQTATPATAIEELQQPQEEPEASRTAYIEMAQDDNTEWNWCLWSANGRPMAVGVMPFKRRNDCEKNVTTAISLFRTQGLKIVAAL